MGGSTGVSPVQHGLEGHATAASKDRYNDTSMRIESTHPAPRALQHPESLRIAIVRSSRHPALLEALEQGARAVLQSAGIPDAQISVHAVPGSFEIPLACEMLAERKEAQGIVALGVIVEGETHHAGEIARACTDGLMQVQLATGVPIAHGVLFVQSLAQADARCRGERNRGSEAAEALLAMLSFLEG